MPMNSQIQPVGALLRQWRQHRRLSQLDLACEADISTRHLSFLETGRAQPSREMLLLLAEQLDIPLRERNRLLSAAGYAPLFTQRELSEPAMAAARTAIELLLKAHEPYPALTIDRHWNLLAANSALAPFLQGIAPELLVPPINVMRLSLHPQGLGARLANAAQWRAHLLHRLDQQFAATADGQLRALREEIAGYPVAAGAAVGDAPPNPIAVPFRLHTSEGLLSFISTVTVFGTPVEVTLQELAIESFFPADEATRTALRRLCPAAG